MTKKSKDPLAIISVSFPVSYVEWIKNNTRVPVSEFVRESVKAKIDATIDYEAKIQDIDKQLREKQNEIDALNSEKFAIEQYHAQKTEELETASLSELIAKAIKKIHYNSWEDAAKDLESARKNISSESYVDLVQAIWTRSRFEGESESVSDY